MLLKKIDLIMPQDEANTVIKAIGTEKIEVSDKADTSDDIQEPALTNEPEVSVSSAETTEEAAEVKNITVSSETVKPVQAASDVLFQNSAVASFLEKSDLFIIAAEKTPDTGGIAYLIDAIVKSLPIGAGFMKSLRTATCQTGKDFYYDLKKQSEHAREVITELANTMRLCGVFTDFVLINGNTIKGKISEAQRVTEFITGRWLEIYSRIFTEKVAGEYAKAHGLDFEVYSNVIVREKGTMQTHEIDLMFSIGDKVFGTEQKSGVQFSDYDKYRKTGIWLGIVPDRFLLLNSNITDNNAAACIRYFYEYYVCSTDNFEQTLTEMIEKAFKE